MGPNQLSLFDPEKYSTPSRDGQPDWFYDTHDGVEDEPSVSPKKGDSALAQLDRQGVEPAKPLKPMVSLPLSQINTGEKIGGGGNSTPGEEAIPGEPKPFYSKDKNLNSTGECDQSIGGDRTGGENLQATAKGDRSIGGDRTATEQNPNSQAMLQNIEGENFCSVASDSTPLTVEGGKAIWDDLIFGQKTENPGRVACKTTGNSGDRILERNDHQRVQSSDFTPDMVSLGVANNAISSENFQLSDQRKHNGKPGASGWIGTQYKYRDPLGNSKTSTQWVPGSTGPYYQYQWREGDRIKSRYVPRKKLEQVELAIMTRESPWRILEILG
ncbi:hypothetical protein [Laspinema palackyanum]|uniref:hypothetical protein n=1 Tax=Laspinema palackyanum TaxID=3231601 RepID=UPI00345D99D0|nr:hypothetical protein [Laspinema sp. D2c]